MNPAYEKLLKCYDSYKAKIDFTPKVALILGSGLGDYADDIRVVDTLDYHDIEGFPVSTALLFYSLCSGLLQLHCRMHPV